MGNRSQSCWVKNTTQQCMQEINSDKHLLLSPFTGQINTDDILHCFFAYLSTGGSIVLPDIGFNIGQGTEYALGCCDGP
jgi:hypothetical protein